MLVAFFKGCLEDFFRGILRHNLFRASEKIFRRFLCDIFGSTYHDIFSGILHLPLYGNIETLSTTTGVTTTAYRKQIFCCGHAQKLNNWLQSAVVFPLATPHSLFWRSVDKAAVYCKVFSPFFDLPFFSYDTYWRTFLAFTVKLFLRRNSGYNEHPGGRKIR